MQHIYADMYVEMTGLPMEPKYSMKSKFSENGTWTNVYVNQCVDDAEKVSWVNFLIRM